MHPILGHPLRLVGYLLAWAALGAVVAAILAGPGSLTWTEASLHGFPLAVAYGLVTLPVWYVCRANPLRGSFLLSAIVAHALASAIFAGVWQVLFRGLAAQLEREGPRWAGVSGRLAPQLPAIFLLGMLLYLLTAAFYYLLLAVDASRRAERQEGEMKLLAGNAELRALRSQLNPHFLFNSLNSISALTTTDPAGARTMCVRLADFLRRTLGLGERAQVRLEEEIGLLDLYLSIEQVRLGERLRVVKRVDDGALRCLVPPLLLQPLVENAVIHGVATLTEGGDVTVEVERRPDRIRILLSNPFDPEAPRRRGSGGRGLENVRRRLAAHFGNDGRLSVEAKNGRFAAVLSVPAREEGAP